MGRSKQAGTPADDAVVLFSPKNISMETLMSVIEDVYPTAKMTPDAQRKQIIIRIPPDQKKPLESLLAQLDTEETDAEKRYFKTYSIETGFYSLQSNRNLYRPLEFVSDLERLAPKAKISFDAQMQQVIVWGTDEDCRGRQRKNHRADTTAPDTRLHGWSRPSTHVSGSQHFLRRFGAGCSPCRSTSETADQSQGIARNT